MGKGGCRALPSLTKTGGRDTIRPTKGQIYLKKDANPKCVEIIKQYAPNLMKYPIKLFNKKSCGEIFDLVVSKKLVPEDKAKAIEAEINKIL